MSTLRTAWRYPVAIDDSAHLLKLPWSAQLLHAAVKRGDPRTVHLWFEVPTSEPRLVERHFRIAGTGEVWSEEDFTHKASCVSPEHDLVWHVLERRT